MKTKKILSVAYFLPFLLMSGGDLPPEWTTSQVLLYFAFVAPNLAISMLFLFKTFKNTDDASN